MIHYSFHGTDQASCVKLSNGGIDVTLGGGELGQGFYTGSLLHEAKQWAFHKSGTKTNNVVMLSALDSDVEAVNIYLLDRGQALALNKSIKANGLTRQYTARCDLIWAPLVGSSKCTGDQYKWESIKAQNLLNGNTFDKSII